MTTNVNSGLWYRVAFVPMSCKSSTRIIGRLAIVLLIAVSSSSALASSEATSQGNGDVASEISAVPTLAGGDLYALLVGISKYKNPGVPPLKVSSQDATDFAEFLTSQKELFNNIHVKVLVNEQATKAELERYLYYDVRKAGKKDTILMFFSGHGSIDPKRPGEFFFLSYDSDPDFLEVSALNMSGLKFLSSLDCPRVIMIADACHSGGFSGTRAKLAVVPMKSFIKDFSTSAGRVVITSSRPEEYSLEQPHLKNSVFTHYFLEGLKGAADQDGNGVVSINEAYNYVYNLAKNSTGGAQHPQFEGTVEGIFPVSVATRFQSGPVTSLELATEPGAEVLVGGKLVGKTGQDGMLYLKYLPLDRPIPVKIRKEGWRDGELGPFVFTKDKLHIKNVSLKLNPAIASVEITTEPGGVTVKMGGEKIGTTGKDGRLIVHGIQVAINHRLELSKEGHQDESFLLTIPVSHEGKKFKGEKIKLARSAPVKVIERSSGQDESARPRRSRSDDPGSGASKPEPRSSPPAGRPSESRMGL